MKKIKIKYKTKKTKRIYFKEEVLKDGETLQQLIKRKFKDKEIIETKPIK